MKNSATILKVAGIEIKVHFTFPLLLIYVAIQWGVTSGAEGAVFGLVFTLSLFACVVLHELGHSFTAKAYGIPVGQIVLLPIGGMSRLSKSPKNPVQEILIAIAGPAVSVALAFLFYQFAGSPVLTAHGFAFEDDGKPELSPSSLVFWLFRANTMLAVFNLIPAFPMDGGRIFRAFLRLFLKEPGATTLASRVGKGFAILFGMVGLIAGQIILALVAVFIFFAAEGEAAEEITGDVLAHIPAGTVCTHYGESLNSTDTLHQALKLILGSEQKNFPVFEGDELVGVLESRILREGTARLRPDTPVPLMMRGNVPRIQSTQNLKEALEEMRRVESQVCAVYEGSRFLGLVDDSRIRLALRLSRFLVSKEG